MKIRIFTDGACSENPGPGGWAAVFNREDGLDILSGHESNTTNNRMELMAVVKAMKKVLKMKNNKDVVYELFSDSAYVVNSINNNWIENWQNNGWKTTRGEDIKNKDLWLEFIRIRDKLIEYKIYIYILKVKGHSGNTFNEYADELARKEVLLARKKEDKR